MYKLLFVKLISVNIYAYETKMLNDVCEKKLK